MSEAEPQIIVPPLQRPWFQFSLRTLLLLFVVLASTLAIFGAWGMGVFAVEMWFAIRLRRAKRVGCATLLVIGLSVLFALLSAFKGVHEAGNLAKCNNNVRQISLALQYYHESKGQFPPAFTVDKAGKPILSWRVQILPYLEYDSLYKRYNLSERWDGPTNKPLSTEKNPEFLCPGDPDSYPSGSAQTNYLAVVGSNAAWTGDRPRSKDDFHGEAASTIMLVEVANSGINWAEPRDLSVDALGAADGKSPAIVPSSIHVESAGSFFFAGDDSPSVNVAMADGSVHSLWLSGLSREELRKILQIGGCGPDVIRKLGEDPSERLNWPNIAALAVWLLSVGVLLRCAAGNRKPSSERRNVTAGDTGRLNGPGELQNRS